MSGRRLNASDFKARCLALLDEVQASGESITILKHGRPVAEVRPVSPPVVEYPPRALRGTVIICGDIVKPTLDDHEIDLERDHV